MCIVHAVKIPHIDATQSPNEHDYKLWVWVRYLKTNHFRMSWPMFNLYSFVFKVYNWILTCKFSGLIGKQEFLTKDTLSKVRSGNLLRGNFWRIIFNAASISGCVPMKVTRVQNQFLLLYINDTLGFRENLSLNQYMEHFK